MVLCTVSFLPQILILPNSVTDTNRVPDHTILMWKLFPQMEKCNCLFLKFQFKCFLFFERFSGLSSRMNDSPYFIFLDILSKTVSYASHYLNSKYNCCPQLIVSFLMSGTFSESSLCLQSPGYILGNRLAYSKYFYIVCR